MSQLHKNVEQRINSENKSSTQKRGLAENRKRKIMKTRAKRKQKKQKEQKEDREKEKRQEEKTKERTGSIIGSLPNKVYKQE